MKIAIPFESIVDCLQTKLNKKVRTLTDQRRMPALIKLCIIDSMMLEIDGQIWAPINTIILTNKEEKNEREDNGTYSTQV